VLEAAPEAVQLPYQHGIKVPPVSIRHEPIKLRAAFTGAADPVVYVLSDNFPATALAVVAKLG
jgi:hypothetical protein